MSEPTAEERAAALIDQLGPFVEIGEWWSEERRGAKSDVRRRIVAALHAHAAVAERERDEALLQRDETRADWVRLVDEHATLEALARRLVEGLESHSPGGSECPLPGSPCVVCALLASPEVAALGKDL